MMVNYSGDAIQASGQRAYREFMAEEGTEEISLIFQKKKPPSLLENEDFLYWGKHRFLKKSA